MRCRRPIRLRFWSDGFKLCEKNGGREIPQREAEVSARITDLVAETELTQRYRFDWDTALDLSYSFSLPANATLLSFRVDIVEASSQERITQGENAPEVNAKLSGKPSIFRLQRLRQNEFEATLTNIRPGDSISISLRFAGLLTWENDLARYHFPILFTPKHLPLFCYDPEEYQFSMEVEVLGALSRGLLFCPAHNVRVKVEANSVRFLLSGSTGIERSFILDMQMGSRASLAALVCARDTRMAVLAMNSPRFEEEVALRDLVTIIRGFEGEDLDFIKKGAKMVLDLLAPRQHFGMIIGGPRSIRPTLQRARKRNLEAAKKWVSRNARPDEAEIDEVLRSALALKSTRPMDILLMIGGADFPNEHSIQKMIDAGIRVFAVDMEPELPANQLRVMAEQTGGAYEVLASTEDLPACLTRQFNRMQRQRIENLKISWPGELVRERRIGNSCFTEDACVVVAELSGAELSEAPVRVSFESSSQHVETIELKPIHVSDAADVLVRIGADQLHVDLPQEARLSWATHYQLITQETACEVTAERGSSPPSVEVEEPEIRGESPNKKAECASVPFCAQVHAAGTFPAFFPLPVYIPNPGVIRRKWKGCFAMGEADRVGGYDIPEFLRRTDASDEIDGDVFDED